MIIKEDKLVILKNNKINIKLNIFKIKQIYIMLQLKEIINILINMYNNKNHNNQDMQNLLILS